MLANGATLGYSTASGSGAYTYTNIPGLKELPEMGEEVERVENTTLTDTIRQYEKGIGDPGSMAYVFKYDKSASGNKAAYAAMRSAEAANTLVHFKETLKDNTATTFSGYVTTRRSGGGVNGVMEWTLNVILASGLEITDPS